MSNDLVLLLILGLSTGMLGIYFYVAYSASIVVWDDPNEPVPSGQKIKGDWNFYFQWPPKLGSGIIFYDCYHWYLNMGFIQITKSGY